MKIFAKNLLLLIFILFSCFSIGQTIQIENTDRQQIKKNISFFKSKERLSLEGILKNQDNFKKTKQTVPSFGITNDIIYFKLTIKNNTNSEDLFLEVAKPIIDLVTFYDSDEKPIQHGDQFKFDDRLYKHTHFLFDLKLKPNQEKTYFLSFSSSTQLQIPIFIGSKDKLMEENNLFNNFLSIFLGVMGGMILYNLAIYFFIKDISYLYYVLYISILTVTQLTPQGYAFQYFWPNSTFMALHSMFIFPIAVGVSGIFFFNNFLKTKRYLPKLIYVYRVFFALYFVALVLMFLKIYNLSYVFVDMTALSVAIAMLIGSILIYRKGNKNALFFLVAWSTFLIGIILWVLKDVGVLPYNFFTSNVMIFGAGLETILLSIGLANRINTLTKEKEIARKNEIQLLKEKEEIIRGQKVELEKKVKERTRELEDALESVEKAQRKLIESEKMASIGQLTAGIAHEINNPINFVTANISSLRRDLKDLDELLDSYNLLTKENFDEQSKQINVLKEEIEIDYLKEEIETLLSGIEEGANRTANIVQSLRVFTKKDQEEKNLASISEGVNSTLMLLKNKLDGIIVEKNYKIDTRILCYSGKLNQVFMNIVVNAIDAIREKEKNVNYSPKIYIETKCDNDFYYIIFEDNGIGMTEEEQNKVFDPFFTTKEVGKGTGLGMSISYQFIALHEGDITINSEKNKGTKFIIKIKKYEK